jgi:hypothetical protein
MPPAADTSFAGAPQFHGWRGGVNATSERFNTPATSKNKRFTIIVSRDRSDLPTFAQ